MFRLAFLTVSVLLTAGAADYRAGVAHVDITPEGPFWLAGYAGRNHPSEGVLHRLNAKALAIADRRGGRVVIVTTDVLGLPRAVTDVVGARIEKEHGLERARILLNSSHTHTGPVIRPTLTGMYNLNAEQEAAVRMYTQQLTEKLVAVVAAALADMKPASLAHGAGQAGFAVNRRERAPNGTIRIGINPSGPTDPSVPVLRVLGEKGELRAVLFGYACHNTTLTGEHYHVSGDYAGFAQTAVEAALPGATALFLQLCAGDQNPNPRGDVRHAEAHGQTLSAEVRRVLQGPMAPLKGEVRAALQWRDLPLQHRTRADFEAMLSDKDPIRVRFAQNHLRAIDERRAMQSVAYPVQALRIGRDFVLVGLGGEPVIEYALQAKSAHPKLRLVIAGYSNDVMGYVPTARMLEEGGYEPIASSMYYGLAAPFTAEVEKTVLETISAVISRVM